MAGGVAAAGSARNRLRSALRRLPDGEAARAQLAGGAGAAAIAPIVARAALAPIAGVCFPDDELDERRATKLLGERPGLGLGPPHQRRLDRERDLGAEPDRLLQS